MKHNYQQMKICVLVFIHFYNLLIKYIVGWNLIVSLILFSWRLKKINKYFRYLSCLQQIFVNVFETPIVWTTRIQEQNDRLSILTTDTALCTV